MKRILMILIMAVFVLAAATAQAETYQVVKGDCLSKIAQKFHVSWTKLFKANKTIISNPDLIFPNQVLRVPEKGSGRVTALSNKAKPFFWKNPNANSFGRRDFIKAINMFNLPQEVKTLLIAEVNSGRFEWHQIRFGDYFEQMASDNYRIVKNVYAQWKPDRLLAAKKYSVKYKDKVYYLADPLICHNWAWWSEIEKAVKPPAEKPPEVVAVPPPPPPPPPEQPKPLMMMLIPAEEEEAPAVAVQQVTPAKTIRKFGKCRPDWEAWAYSGVHVGAQSQNRKNWDMYYGGNISFFPCKTRLGKGIFRAGPSAQFVGWEGRVEDKISYRGDMALFGGEAQYITGKTKDYLKVLYGTKMGDVWGKDFPYESSEKNRMYAVEGAHQWWYGRKRKWFREFEVGFRLELAEPGKKHSSFAGVPIDDPAQDQSFYSIRGKTEYYAKGPVTLTAENSWGYRGFDQSIVMEPRAGVKLYDTIEFDVSYSWIEHSQNDMVGAHIILNASKLTKILIKKFKAKAKKAEKTTEKQEVVK